jgi:uncharacterized delta-60 repeat protein
MSDLDTTTFNSPNGFLTTTFNTIVSEPLPQDVAVSVVIRSDNRIIMGGYSTYSTGSYITLSCYNTDGSLYTGFGSGTGKVLEPTPLTPNPCIVNDVVLQSNDYIVVTGYLQNSLSFNSIFVTRFDSNGNLDLTFGSGTGSVLINPVVFNSGVFVFDNCYSNSVIIQPSDGYIVLGGYVRKSSPGNTQNFIALVRLQPNGLPDASFGTNGNGTLYANFTSLNNDICSCLSIQTDGKIVSGGVTIPLSTPTDIKFAVSRFNTNGSVDTTTFNSSSINPGCIIIPHFFTNSTDYSNGLGINNNGDIIIGGFTIKTSGESCYAIASVTTSGSLDLSFGVNGQTVLDLSPTYNLIGPSFTSGSNSLALQTDNKIVITGGFINTITGAEGFSLARFDTNGALDLTFGVAGLGYILSNLVSPNTEVGYSVAIQTDGKVLVGGTAINSGDTGSNTYFILARYFYTPIPVPIAPICFPAGTPVLTDQGYIEIDKIEPSNNTINGRPIIAVTKTIPPSNKLVCFERGSLGYNIPNRTTYISTDHCIVYRNKLIEAHKFVNRKRRIYYIKYNGKYLYNILMNRHYCMTVNNIKVETLNPKNIIAKLYTNDYNDDYKIELIKRINKHYLHKADHSQFKENVSKNMMLNYTRSKNQRYRIHRYNPLIDYTSFFTRKRAYNADHYPVVNVALQNTTNTTKVVDKESIQHVPQILSEPVLVEPKAVEPESIKTKITRPKIKIDIIGKNKVTLKRIVGANNKLRICSHKYIGNKRK